MHHCQSQNLRTQRQAVSGSMTQLQISLSQIEYRKHFAQRFAQLMKLPIGGQAK